MVQEPHLDALREIVHRIVEVAQPERIILFGSAARDEMKSHSDVDVLVVKANVHRRKLAQKIYLNLIGVDQAVDVVVATPEDLEQYRDTPGLVFAPALRDGVEGRHRAGGGGGVIGRQQGGCIGWLMDWGDPGGIQAHNFDV